jgi:lysyl-tRNA synthetase class 2
MQHLSEQEIIRRQYREELYAMGINPYPAEMFVINTTAKTINGKDLKNSRMNLRK